jgi:hypothetical protein
MRGGGADRRKVTRNKDERWRCSQKEGGCATRDMEGQDKRQHYNQPGQMLGACKQRLRLARVGGDNGKKCSMKMWQ